MSPEEEYDEKFNELRNSEKRYITKQEVRMRQFIKQEVETQKTVEVCDLEGDRTLLMNYKVICAEVEALQTQSAEQQEVIEYLKNQIAVIEELQKEITRFEKEIAAIETGALPEDVQTDIRRLKNQIKDLRASGFSTPGGPTIVGGISHGVKEAFDPTKQSETFGQFSYKGNHTALLNEIKQFQIDKEMREKPKVEEVDSGSQFTVRDESKCHEPILEKGVITQCPNFRVGESLYCDEHKKSYERRPGTDAKF